MTTKGDLQSTDLAAYWRAASISLDPTATIRQAIVRLLGADNIDLLRLPKAVEKLSSIAQINLEKSTVSHRESDWNFNISRAKLLFATPINPPAGQEPPIIRVNGDNLQVSGGHLGVDWPEDGRSLTVSTTITIGSENSASELYIVRETQAATRGREPATLRRVLTYVCQHHEEPLEVPDFKTLTCSLAVSLLMPHVEPAYVERYLLNRWPAALVQYGLKDLVPDPERSTVTAELSTAKNIGLSDIEFVVDARRLNDNTNHTTNIAGLEMKFGDIRMSLKTARPFMIIGDMDFGFAADVSISSSDWHSSIQVPHVHPIPDSLALDWIFTAHSPAKISTVFDLWKTHEHAVTVAEFPRVPLFASKLSDLITVNAGFILSQSNYTVIQPAVSTIFAILNTDAQAGLTKYLPSTFTLSNKTLIDTARLEIRSPLDPESRSIAVSIDLHIAAQLDSPSNVKAAFTAETPPGNQSDRYQLEIQAGVEDSYSPLELMKPLGLEDQATKLPASLPLLTSVLPSLHLHRLLISLEGKGEEARPLTPGDITIDANFTVLHLVDKVDFLEPAMKFVFDSSPKEWTCTVSGFVEISQNRVHCLARLPQKEVKGYIEFAPPHEMTGEQALQAFNLTLPTWPEPVLPNGNTGLRGSALSRVRVYLDTSRVPATLSGYRVDMNAVPVGFKLGSLQLSTVEASITQEAANGELSLHCEGHIQQPESMDLKVTADYRTSTRDLKALIQGTTKSLPCSTLAKCLWPETTTDNMLWGAIEKFLLDRALVSFSMGDSNVVSVVSANVVESVRFKLERLEIGGLQLSWNKTDTTKGPLSAFTMVGIALLPDEEHTSAKIACDAFNDTALAVSVIPKDDKTPMSLKTLTTLFDWDKSKFLPSLPPDTKDPDFMTLPIRSARGTAISASSNDAWTLQSLEVMVMSTVSCPIPGDGSAAMQNLRLKVNYTKSDNDVSFRSGLWASLSTMGAISPPVDLEYRDGRFLLPSPAPPPKTGLQVDIAKAMREASLAVHAECGELFGLTSEQAVGVTLSLRASVGRATSSLLTIDVLGSFELSLPQKPTPIRVDATKPLKQLDVMWEHFPGIDLLADQVSKSLLKPEELSKTLGNALLEQPELASQLISVMKASSWPPETLIALVCRSIVPENVWNAVSTDLNVPVLNSAAWLQEMVRKADDLDMHESFQDHLRKFNDIVSAKLEFEKKAQDTVDALRKAMAPSGHPSPAQLDACNKIKKSYDDTLSGGQVQVERIKAMVRACIVLHGLWTANARFSPKYGFVRTEWAECRYSHTFEDAALQTVTWETVIGPPGISAPDNEAEDVTSLPGYDGRPGVEDHAEYQRSHLVSAREIVVWARVKYIHEFSWGKFCFISTDWNKANVLRMGDGERISSWAEGRSA